MPKVAVLINPRARLNRHQAFLDALPDFLRTQGLDLSQCCELQPDKPLLDQAQAFVKACLDQQDQTHFVAVGGDGTVNLLATALAEETQLFTKGPQSLFLGAIGTGSSNDYHKPFRASFHGIPYRLNFSEPIPRDCVLVRTDTKRYYFLNGFGMGFVADGNWRFNHPSRLLRCLKKLHISTAIAYTSLAQLLSLRSQQMELAIDDSGFKPVEYCNFNLVKNPHIAGSFRYENTVGLGDGLMAMHGVRACGLPAFVRILARLLNGKFVGRPNTFSARTNKVALKSEVPFCFEVDGEVYTSTQAEISVLRGCFNAAT